MVFSIFLALASARIEEAPVFNKTALKAPMAYLEGCDIDIQCIQVEANGQKFDCRTAGSKDDTPVMMLHGFPEWGSMYMKLQKQLADKGYYSIACNQRGYSPGARPDGVENYNYNNMIADTWAVADEMGFKKFHLIGHDHGAVLGWHVAATDRAKTDLYSYTALSIPHMDAFSAGLYGPNADKDQQVASQYFTMFTLPDSASRDFDALYLAAGNPLVTGGKGTGETWPSASEFQKAIWWYNGALAAGHLAQNPQYDTLQLAFEGIGNLMGIPMATARAMFGKNPDWPDNGAPAKNGPIGKVTIPTLYVCGSLDPAILCNHEYALNTKNYVDADHYTQLTVSCAHDLLGTSNVFPCISWEVDKVTAAIEKLLDESTTA